MLSFRKYIFEGGIEPVPPVVPVQPDPKRKPPEPKKPKEEETPKETPGREPDKFIPTPPPGFKPYTKP